MPSFSSYVNKTDGPSTSASSETQRLSLSTELVSEPPECANPTTEAVAQSKTEQSIKKCCKQCDYTTSDFKKLKSHVWKRHHTRIHQSGDCRHVSYDETYEASHRSQSCQLNGTYLCEICGIKLPGFVSWHKHDMMHRSDPMIRCCYCPFKSTYRSVVIKHQTRHTDDYFKVRCPYCAWGCTLLFKALAHIRSFHTGRC